LFEALSAVPLNEVIEGNAMSFDNMTDSP